MYEDQILEMKEQLLEEKCQKAFLEGYLSRLAKQLEYEKPALAEQIKQTLQESLEGKLP